jgi:flagellar basal-body rod protein FlgF
MDKALYIAMTGAKHNMLAQTNHANNLANVNTNGFKADMAQARSMPVYYGEGLPTRAYALTENNATDFRPGPLMTTGRDLDIAIEGEGFIAVQAEDGLEAYTRSGALYVDSVGILRSGNGLPVLGEGGPVALPPSDKIEIARDGTISVVPQGQRPDALVQIDRIRLVNPALDTMEKFADGLIRPRDPAQQVVADAQVTLVSGHLEGSNVNAVNELTSMLSLARQYEMNVKVMKTVQENSEASTRMMQMS